jgi:hypothetical protein
LGIEVEDRRNTITVQVSVAEAPGVAVQFQVNVPDYRPGTLAVAVQAALASFQNPDLAAEYGKALATFVEAPHSGQN